MLDDTAWPPNSNRDPPTQVVAMVATEDGFKSTTSVALGLSVTDDVRGGGKELSDPSQFELQQPRILLGRRRVHRHRSNSIRQPAMSERGRR
jgi:hypothetical protein